LNRSRSIPSIIFIFLIILTILGMVWGTYHLDEYNIFDAGFSVQWLSIRSLVTDGTDPYSEIITEKIQNTVKSEYTYVSWQPPKYTSPLFSGLVIFPFALLSDETLAHALWSALQLLAIFVIIWLGLRITGWKPAWYIFFLFSLFSIFSYHIVVPWLDGGLSIWAAFFLVLALLMIYSNLDEAGGIILGLAMIQPLMVFLPALFVLIWAGTHRRKKIILWFFITIILLSLIGLFFVPDWIMQYFRVLYHFMENFPPGSPGVLFQSIWPGLGKQLGWILSGICAVVLMIEWWLALRKDFRWFLWTVCLTIVISHWIGIPTVPMNLIGMIFALILVSAMMSERWPRGGQWVAVLLAFLLCVWEWALFYGNIIGTHPGMQSNLLIPLPFILLIGLYWVRWWAIKPRGLLIDELRYGETH
jgi:hypothetical protein